MPGPPPKRSDQRRRRNKPRTEVTKGTAGPPPVPEARRPNSQWHPVAKRFFEALAASGQAEFYEASDWAVAELLCESISRELKPQSIVVGDRVMRVATSPPAAKIQAWLQGARELLASEASRRRLAIELERPKGGDDDDEDEGGGDVVWLADAAARANGTG